MKLTAKQQRFCDEYNNSLNVVNALIISGIELSITPCNKYFVYLLCDPRNQQIFYIGKGTKKRPHGHIREANSLNASNRFKANRIREILSTGYEVDIYYFEKNLDESQAFKLERQLIKAIGTENLTNISGGVSKASVREQALYMLSIIIPFDIWLKKRGNATDFEKQLYWHVKETYQKIADHGYVYAIEQKRVNGKLEIIEKRRM